MKKLILLALTALIMIGCDQQDVANDFKKMTLVFAYMTHANI